MQENKNITACRIIESKWMVNTGLTGRRNNETWRLMDRDAGKKQAGSHCSPDPEMVMNWAPGYF